MKKIFICLFSVVFLILFSCDKKGLGDNYDFNDKVAPYVAFSNTSPSSVKEGATVTIPFLVRTAIQADVDITLSISGAFSKEQVVVLPKGTTTVNASVIIPTGLIKAPATTATATVAIVKAVAKNGTEFSLGRLNDPNTQKKLLNISLPN